MPLVVHFWADLQSVHGLRCYGNIMRMRNVSEYMLELAVCLHFCNWSYCFRTQQLIRFQNDRSSRGPSVCVEMRQDVPGVWKMSSLRILTRSERRPISTTAASCTAVHYGCWLRDGRQLHASLHYHSASLVVSVAFIGKRWNSLSLSLSCEHE